MRQVLRSRLTQMAWEGIDQIEVPSFLPFFFFASREIDLWVGDICLWNRFVFIFILARN